MKPIIAAVKGFAVAGGTEIPQGTDIRVAAEDAVFGVTEARKIAAEICENGPLSIPALMRMLREIDESYIEADALSKELEYTGPVFASNDAREGPRAFAERRKPNFTGE